MAFFISSISRSIRSSLSCSRDVDASIDVVSVSFCPACPFIESLDFNGNFGLTGDLTASDRASYPLVTRSPGWFGEVGRRSNASSMALPTSGASPCEKCPSIKRRACSSAVSRALRSLWSNPSSCLTRSPWESISRLAIVSASARERIWLDGASDLPGELVADVGLSVSVLWKD